MVLSLGEITDQKWIGSATMFSRNAALSFVSLVRQGLGIGFQDGLNTLNATVADLIPNFY